MITMITMMITIIMMISHFFTLAECERRWDPPTAWENHITERGLQGPHAGTPHYHHVIFILHHHIIRVRSPSSRHYIVIILTQFIIILSSSSCKMRPLIGISCWSCITIVITLRYHIIIYHCHIVNTALSPVSDLFLRKAFISLQLTLSKSAQYF